MTCFCKQNCEVFSKLVRWSKRHQNRSIVFTEIQQLEWQLRVWPKWWAPFRGNKGGLWLCWVWACNWDWPEVHATGKSWTTATFWFNFWVEQRDNVKPLAFSRPVLWTVKYMTKMVPVVLYFSIYLFFKNKSMYYHMLKLPK